MTNSPWSNKELLMRQALEEVRQVWHPCVIVPARDPDYYEVVKALGQQIGYGALMTAASRAWRETLEADGWPVGGEFVSGPCRATVERCLRQINAVLEIK